MKNLDLNSYGVQEMDAKAMKEANGGESFAYRAGQFVREIGLTMISNFNPALKSAFDSILR